MQGIPKLLDYINDLSVSPEMKKLVTPRFIHLSAEKKVLVVEAVCKEAVSRSDPSKLNIKDVAKAGDIAVGTLYTYFQRREDLLQFTILIVKEFILSGMQASEKYLQMLPLSLALFYYCIGGQMWSEREQLLARFFFKAAYSGNPVFRETLVKPAAECFRQVIFNLIEKAWRRRKLKKPLNYYADFLYSSLIPLADTLIYPELGSYFVPGGLSKKQLKERISTLLSCIK